MKKLILFLILLFITTTITTAISEDLIYDAEQIQTRLTIKSDLTILKTSSDYKVSLVVVNLSFLPKNTDNQKVQNIRYQPKPISTTKEVIYGWDNVGLGTYDFLLEAELENNINFKKISKKIGFPIQDLPEEYRKYTLQTENIDSEDLAIIKKASEIAAGQDDLYVVSFELVKWIKSNVRYDLNTLTAESTQKSSWVLINKYGVCDEITSLFIAMARSLGIPAKYVSGVAYTNWNNLNDWGPHAWAEVYFPGQGWVAFDITYGEFGYVDASHIVLKESLDSSESSTHYEWKGRNIDIDAQNLNIKVEQLGKKGTHEDNIKITVTSLKQETGFGSYNLVEAEIQNLGDYYVAEELALAKVDEVKVIGEERRQVLLKPGETKKTFWIIQLTEDLKPNYVYTIPLKVYTPRNKSAETILTAKYRNPNYDEAEIRQAMQQANEEESKTYSRQVIMDCSAKETVYFQQPMIITCKIKNSGNTMLEGLQVCVGSDCKMTELGITQEKEEIFTITPAIIGKQELTITAKSKDISKASYVDFEVLDRPGIQITEVDAPQKVYYAQEFSISFVINKSSYNSPKNILVSLWHNKLKQEWKMDSLNFSQEFIVKANSNNLINGENKFNIRIDYFDERGNKYTTQKDFVVVVEADKFMDKLKLFINKVEYFLQGLFQ